MKVMAVGSTRPYEPTTWSADQRRLWSIVVFTTISAVN
jgi:hypothetical protein